MAEVQGKRGVAVAHLAFTPRGIGSNPDALTLLEVVTASVIQCNWRIG